MLLVLFGLAIRIWFLIAGLDVPLFSDARCYHDVAVQMGTSNTFSTFWPPAHPFYLYLWHKIFGAGEVVSKIAILPWYILFCIFLVLVVKRLFGLVAANVSLVVVAVFPTIIYHSIFPFTQLQAGACLLLIVYLLVKYLEKPIWRYTIAFALVSAFLVLLRPSSLALFFLLVAYLFLRGRKVVHALLVLVIVLGVVSGWMYKANRMTGRLVLINDSNSMNLFYGNNPYTPLYKTWWFGSHWTVDEGVPEGFISMMKEIKSKPIDEQQSAMRKLAIEHILKRPDLFIIRSASRFRCFFSFPTITGSMLRSQGVVSTRTSLFIILIDGLIYITIFLTAIMFLCSNDFSSPGGRYYKLILLIVSGYALPYWFCYSHPTYNFPVIPLFLVLSMGYFKGLIEEGRGMGWFPLKGKRRVFGILVMLAFLAIQVEWVIRNLSRI